MEPISLWVIIGVALLVLELVTVSFYAIFFGIGALITALVVYLGLADELTAQLIIFGIASMGSLLMFRKKLLEVFNKSTHKFTEIVDDYALVSLNIPADGEGKVFYRGSDWIAYTNSNVNIDAKSKVKILKIDGIKLVVDPA